MGDWMLEHPDFQEEKEKRDAEEKNKEAEGEKSRAMSKLRNSNKPESVKE